MWCRCSACFTTLEFSNLFMFDSGGMNAAVWCQWNLSKLAPINFSSNSGQIYHQGYGDLTIVWEYYAAPDLRLKLKVRLEWCRTGNSVHFRAFMVNFVVSCKLPWWSEWHACLGGRRSMVQALVEANIFSPHQIFASQYLSTALMIYTAAPRSFLLCYW